MFLILGHDNLTSIFSYLVDTGDIITLAKVCRFFYQTIWKSIQVIKTCHRKTLPSTWLRKFCLLQTVIPTITVVNGDDLTLMAKQLITASLYLPSKSFFQHVLDFMKEQRKHQTRRSFNFTGMLDLVITQDSISYIGQENILLADLTIHLQTRSLITSVFLDPLPSYIQDFTYSMGVRYPSKLPLLDPYLDREKFAVYSYNKSSRCLENYLQFRDNFQRYFQHRCYPNLQQLDVGLTLTDYDLLRKKGCFPHLNLVSLCLEVMKVYFTTIFSVTTLRYRR